MKELVEAGKIKALNSKEAFIEAAQKVMKKQGGMVVKNVNDVIAEVFEVTGFSDILTVM